MAIQEWYQSDTSALRWMSRRLHRVLHHRVDHSALTGNLDDRIALPVAL
jgi:hypothetical protein